jgi:hypothetical protein
MICWIIFLVSFVLGNSRYNYLIIRFIEIPNKM